MRIVILAFLFILGAVFGSFLCCQARRIHEKDAHGKKYGRRSICFHCGEKLSWYDNLPIISWTLLRGRCRKCGAKIGVAEILSEILTGVALVLISLGFDFFGASGLGWAEYIITIFAFLGLIFLGIYDGLYGELPVLALTFSGICGIMVVSVRFFTTGASLAPLGAVAILGGTYLVLYLASKGRLVGSGDWALGAIIGMLLGEPFLALFALFISNFLACAVMLPTMRRKKSRKIYFGPFMVAGYVITAALGEVLIGLIMF